MRRALRILLIVGALLAALVIAARLSGRQDPIDVLMMFNAPHLLAFEDARKQAAQDETINWYRAGFRYPAEVQATAPCACRPVSSGACATDSSRRASPS